MSAPIGRKLLLQYKLVCVHSHRGAETRMEHLTKRYACRKGSLAQCALDVSSPCEQCVRRAATIQCMDVSFSGSRADTRVRARLQPLKESGKARSGSRQPKWGSALGQEEALTAGCIPGKQGAQAFKEGQRRKDGVRRSEPGVQGGRFVSPMRALMRFEQYSLTL